MTTALILAGGLGSRLYKYTHGLYPKILLSAGNETFLDKVINFWLNEQKVSQLTFVFSEDNHINLIREYINIFHKDKLEHINITKYANVDGTFNTLYYTFLADSSHLKSNLIVSWSDILPKSRLILLDKPSGIKIFTDANKIHRCAIDEHNQIDVSSKAGNIPGLYNIKGIDLGSFIQYKEYLHTNKFALKEVDFVNYLKYKSNHNMLIAQEQVEIIDIGDSDKYENYLETNSIDQRWFNDIEFKDNLVIKKANSAYGRSVIKSEIDFYNNMIDFGKEASFPIIVSTTNDTITMENLNTKGFITVNEYLKTQDNKKILFENYTNEIKKLHGETKEHDFTSDVYKEYIQVTVERYSKIQNFIPSDVSSVNFNRINTDFYEVINKLHSYLKTRKYNWSIIHGDTNSTNTMYNPYNNAIKFIDPRGKFGDSMLYGDTDYDYAKFLYGITGYDKFNLDKTYKFSISGNSINLPNLSDLDKLDELTDNEHLKLLVGLIWLKLPFYIKNNPNKIIASYFIGMYLIHKYLP